MSEAPTAARDDRSLGVLEVIGLGPALVILDAAEKSANVRLLQAELNDYYGYVMKVVGDAAAVQSAIDTGQAIADRMHANCVSSVIESVDARAWAAIESPREYQPLINQDVVFIPHATAGQKSEQSHMSERSEQFAIGLIETQGFTAVIEAIDTACKAANVEVIGKEKLGGGYVTVLIKGDVAAVEAAISAGREAVNGLGHLIAAHVIARPSDSVLGLLPKPER